MVDDVLGAVRERLRTPPSCGVAGLDRVVADALRPGKLLRPGLVVGSAAAAGAGLADRALRHRVVLAAEAMELLHVATLVHDDIIDGSPLRRGRPSVVASAGVASALVVGDLLLARGALAAAGAAPNGPLVWARALACMARGQLLEADLRGAPSVEAHREYAALKTAELFRASAEIGALAVDAEPDVVRAHGEFGLHFGIAFQHVDDLLDVVGDPARTGKPAGLDAANGVPTTAALLLEVPSPGGLAALVAAELEDASASLPPGRGSAELRAWAADALRRTLHAADDRPRRTIVQLSAVLDRFEHDIHPVRETTPCTPTPVL